MANLSPVNTREQVLLASLEHLICKLPSILHNLPKTIGVELPDKAGEIVVLKVMGKKVARELRRLPHNKGSPIAAPRNDGVSRGIVNELEGFGEERGRWHWSNPAGQIGDLTWRCR